MTLPLDEQIFIVQNLQIYPWLITKFYFGLLGDFHANNFTAVSLPFKYFSATSEHLANSIECDRNISHSLALFSILEEIGWSGNAYRKLLNLAGIIANSSACVTMDKYSKCYRNRTLSYSISYEDSDRYDELFSCLRHFIENSLIHGLSVIMSHPIDDHYDKLLPRKEVTLYDPDHYLNTTHLQLLKCFHSRTCSVPRESRSAIKYYHLWFRYGDSNNESAIISAIKRFQEMFSVQFFGLTLQFYYRLGRNHDESAQKKLWSFLNNLNISTLNVNVRLDPSYFDCIKDMSEISRICTYIPYITTLTLHIIWSCTRLKFTSLSSILKHPDKLKILKISGQIPNKNFDTLLIGLTSLEYLHIYNDHDTLKGNNKKIDNNIITERVANQLVELEMSNSGLHRSAVNSLAKKFHLFLKLQTLDFSMSFLADSDLNILSEHMTYLRSLRHLDLAGNEINGDELPSLVGALMTIETFQSLNLYRNPITGDENIEALAQLTNLRSL